MTDIKIANGTLESDAVHRRDDNRRGIFIGRGTGSFFSNRSVCSFRIAFFFGFFYDMSAFSVYRKTARGISQRHGSVIREGRAYRDYRFTDIFFYTVRRYACGIGRLMSLRRAVCLRCRTCGGAYVFEKRRKGDIPSQPAFGAVVALLCIFRRRRAEFCRNFPSARKIFRRNRLCGDERFSRRARADGRGHADQENRSARFMRGGMHCGKRGVRAR